MHAQGDGCLPGPDHVDSDIAPRDMITETESGGSMWRDRSASFSSASDDDSLDKSAAFPEQRASCRSIIARLSNPIVSLQR
jgi:hypothetical protein